MPKMALLTKSLPINDIYTIFSILQEYSWYGLIISDYYQ